MSSWTDICEAWVEDIRDNVPELADAKSHMFAPWSLEKLFTNAGERHFAVWPEAEAETLTGLTTQPSQLANQQFVVLVWEDAGPESGRLMDDDTANAAWLDLQVAVRSRFLEIDNIRLGTSVATPIMDTVYLGCSFPPVDGRRVMELKFRVRIEYGTS